MSEPALDPYDPEERSLNVYLNEAGGAKNPISRPHLSVVGDNQKVDSPDQLANKEAAVPAANNSTDNSDNLNYTGNKNRPSTTGKAISQISKIASGNKKWLMFGGLGGLIGVLGLLFGLFLLASLLKIPNLSQDIVEFQFARMTREFGQMADRSTNEALAVDLESQNPKIQSSLEKSYQNLRDNTWGRLDKYRPSLVAETLKNEHKFKLITSHTILGNTAVDGVEIDGTPYYMEPVTGIAKFVPGLSQILNIKSQSEFAAKIQPVIADAIEADNVAPIIRGSVANILRKEIGINLVAWTLSKFQNTTTQAAADDEINRQAFNAENNPNPESSLVPEIDSTASAVQADTAAAVNSPNPSALETAEANAGIVQTAKAALGTALSGSTLDTITNIISPTYGIALPACIIYEGSLDESGPTINSQTQSQEKAFYFLASAGDEEKSGGPPDSSGYAESAAVGAMNQKLGNISQSNAYLRADGGTVDTSSSALSSEASPDGQYTLLDATPGISGTLIGNSIKTLANATCPVLSNVWVGLGTGIAITAAQILPDIFSLGTTVIAENAAKDAAEVALDSTINTAADSFVNRFIIGFQSTLAGQSTGDIVAKARDIIGISDTKDAAKTVLTTAGLVGLTIIAKMVTMAHANSFYNGLEQGADYANEADSGGNIAAGELERQQLFGRPLTCAEIQQSDQADQQFIADQNQSQSLSNRYLDPSNPDSMLSRMASAVYTDTNGSVLPFGNLFGVITNSFGSLVGTLFGVAQAAAPCSQEDYGNVQFGWSQSEENLIDSSDSYQMLENQQVLDASGDENAIANDYADCFGYQYNPGGDGNFDPTDPNGDLQSDVTGAGSIGTLLSDGEIARDVNGDVIANQGNCSPNNLGPNNPTFGDLVFRWRLAMSYDTTVDQLTNMESTSS